MKSIFIIGAGIMQIPVILEAKKLGYKVIVSDRNFNAEGLKYADIPLVIDTLDIVNTLKAARELDIDGIITASDMPVRTVAYVCNKIGLPGLTPSTALISTNKYLLREELSKSDLTTPKYTKFEKYTDNDIIEQFKFPFILKPVDSSASRGVSLVRKKSELKDAFYEALKYSYSGEVLCEEYINGREFSVETLTQNNETTIVAITEKFTKGFNLQYFVEDRHIIPASLTNAEYSLIEETIMKALNIIGLNDSASHSEIKLTEKGPVIIEIGARLGGDYITSDLVPLATGVNMIENIIKLSLGEQINTLKNKNRYAGVQFVNSENYVLVVRHIQKNKSDPRIIRFDLQEYVANKELKNSLDRLGYYICTADTRDELLNLLNYTC